MTNSVDYEVLQGAALNDSKYLEVNTAMNIVSEFFDVNAAAIVKNASPVGVALGMVLEDAYKKALDTDPVNSLGATIGFSKEIDENLAKRLAKVPFATIIAPDFIGNALEILKSAPALQIVKIITPLNEYKLLADEIVNKTLDKSSFKVVTKTKPTAEQIEDSIFAWKICKYAAAQAVVAVKDFKTVAVVQGSKDLAPAVESAMDCACDASKNAVIAVSGAIDELETINAAAQGRISLILETGGAADDIKIIAHANKLNTAMIFTGV